MYTFNNVRASRDSCSSDLFRCISSIHIYYVYIVFHVRETLKIRMMMKEKNGIYRKICFNYMYLGPQINVYAIHPRQHKKAKRCLKDV